MKRSLKTLLLMLAMLLSISLSVSAKSKETYFEEDGVQYCWLRGNSTEEPDPIPGYRWIKVYKADGKPVTQLGDCDEHPNNEGCDLFCAQLRLEYKYQLVTKEVMLIEATNEEGYAMIGTEFVLLKHQIKTNEDGSYDLDENGQLQYNNSVVIGKGTVEKDGYARMRLNEDRLDLTEEHIQLVLAQVLPDEQLDTYVAVQKKWFVNLVLQDGIYEVYSVKDAPYDDKIKDPAELKDHGFGELEPADTDEFNYTNQVLKTRNYYRVGDIIVNISVEGFEGEIPSRVRTNITITGPEDYSKRLRGSETLKDMRMGEYTISCSNPVTVENYIAEKPVVTVQSPMNADPVELTEDVKSVLLNRDHVNAKINITYTYIAQHVHKYDEGVETEPTCTEEGYTTYKCMDPECGHTYRDNYVESYGHFYKEEYHERSCIVDGGMVYTCLYCGYSYSEVEEPATGHKYDDDDKKVTKPTCTEQGYTTYTCEVCGFSYRDDYVEALEHRFVDIEPLEPTCTEPGYNVQKCLKCDEELKEPTEPAYGHNYDNDDKMVTAPTCTEKGYTTFICSNEGCGYSYKGEEVEATGHSYTSKVIEPTTEREGYTLHTCSVCNDTYTDNHKDKLTNNSNDVGNSDSDDSSAEQAPTATPAPAVTSAPSVSTSEPVTLIVKSVDDMGNPLNGTTVALYNGRSQLHSWSCTYDNVAVLDNLGDYVKEGETVSLTLVQTKTPNGYDVSEDSFTVKLNKRNGKVAIDVKKDTGLFGGSVSKSNDGKSIVTFSSNRQVAHVGVCCNVTVEFNQNCQVDETLIEEYQNQTYEFVLKWMDSQGKEQNEKVRLSHGEVALMEAQLPLGAEYEITCVDAEGNPIAGFSENSSGTISSIQVEENLVVEANLKYTVKMGDDLRLKMIVLDESGKPLEGASFELKDPEGKKIGNYFSHKNGEFYIEDTFNVTGDYLLTQIAAPEGYEPIKGGAPVIVSKVCVPEAEAGNQVLVQSMVAKIAHQAVSQEEDGTFRIKNATVDAVEAGSSNGKGLGLKGILGIVAAVVVLIGGSVTAFIVDRKIKNKFAGEDDEFEDAADSEDASGSEEALEGKEE